MAGIMLDGLAIAVAITTGLVWFALRRRPRITPSGTVAPVMRAARRRAVAALLVAVVAGGALLMIGASVRPLLGAPFACAATIAVAAGLLLYAAIPPRMVRVGRESPRTATLVPRTAWTVLPPTSRFALVCTPVALAVFLVATGVTSTTDDLGLHRAISFASVEESSRSSPYPGWFYGVPAVIGTGALMLATVVALHRIAATPAFPEPAQADLDMRWRRRSAHVIATAALAAVLFELGGMMVFAGTSIRNAALQDRFVLLGDAVTVAGAIVLISSVVAATLAALRAISLAGLGASHGRMVAA